MQAISEQTPSLKAQPTEPLELTYKDFDNNGTIDPILTYYVQGKSYPFAGRDEMVNQIGVLRKKFPDYASYSTATLTDIFTPGDLKGARVLSATELRTVFYKNTGSKFEKHILPQEAQFSPVYAIEVFDYNRDGNLTLFLQATRVQIA